MKLPSFLIPVSVQKKQRVLKNWKKSWQYAFFQDFLGINRQVPWPTHWSSTVSHPEKVIRKVTTRPNPGVQPATVIIADNGIHIGANVWMGPGVKLISARPDPQDYTHMLPAPPIEIGDDCWLGAGAILYPGVVLGKHVVVAAGAVVMESFTQNDILIGGNPARVLKPLDPYTGSIPTSDNEETTAA